MPDRVHYHLNLIFSVGTQVVTLVDFPGCSGLILHPRGTVGVIVKSPTDREHSYRIRFPDGFEAPLKRGEVTMLAQFKEGEIGDSTHVIAQTDLYERVIYRCVIGSQDLQDLQTFIEVASKNRPLGIRRLVLRQLDEVFIEFVQSFIVTL